MYHDNFILAGVDHMHFRIKKFPRYLSSIEIPSSIGRAPARIKNSLRGKLTFER